MGDLYDAFKEQLEHEKGIAMATVVRGPTQVGSKLLIYSNGTTRGSLGNVELERQVLADARRIIWRGDADTYTYTLEHVNYDVFLEGFPPPPSLIIVGAGHIAIALTAIAKTLNYHVTVIDARAAFATRERFSLADELIVAWPDEVLAKMDLNPATSIAVLTHDPKFDEPTLKVVLSHQVGYVGAIGSRKTNEERALRLQQQGLTREQIQQIHGPIGLNIGATTPEEMALAIMAEVVAARHGKDHTTLLNWSKK